jgi:hypothetical protein
MRIFDTPGPISVELELGVADLRIVASDRVDTVVEVEPSNPNKHGDVTAASETSVQYADGILRIKGPKGWKRYSWRGAGGSIDVRIELPTGSRLRCEAALVSLRSSGTLGECRYSTGVGDLTIENVTGDVDLSTATGEVRIERIGGSADLTNSNGDIWVGEVSGEIRARAANGKITAGRAHAAVTAKAANGDIRLGEVFCGEVVASTACGKVEIGVSAGVAAWLDLHTGFGQVRNLLDATDRPDPSEETVKVRARTSFGDITIRRQADLRDNEHGDTELRDNGEQGAA